MGSGAPTVDVNGKITGHSYASPQDLNSNSVDDFLEISGEAGIFSQPTSVLIDEEDDTIFVSQASLQTTFTAFAKNHPDGWYGGTHVFVNSNSIYQSGFQDFGKDANSLWFVVEFDSITDVTITGLSFMFQNAGHSYYYSPNRKVYDDAVTFAQESGGYLVVINNSHELELVREEVRKKRTNTNFWVNHFRDPENKGYIENDRKTGWLSGYIPNSNVTYQWQVGVIGSSDTTWTDISDGTNYSGVNTETLRIKAAPASFDKNLYRLKASTSSFACTSGPAYSKPAQLTVSSDPDNDGVKNSDDLDDDNDGILDTEEGGKDLDTDGDGIQIGLTLTQTVTDVMM